MKTIETTAAVTDDHQLIVRVQLPEDVLPGEHRVVLISGGVAARVNQAVFGHRLAGP